MQETWDTGLIPEWGRCPGEGMATHSSILAWRGPWRAIVHGVAKSWTCEQLKWLNIHISLLNLCWAKYSTLKSMMSVLLLAPFCMAVVSIPVLLPGKSPAWTEEPGRLQSMGSLRVRHDFLLSCIGEGNGNPLQCSCLENPRDGGAWWAAVSGVAQSRTRLKWLSSSSSFYL